MELEKKMLVSDVAEKFVGTDRYFSNFAPIDEASEDSIVWAKHSSLCYHTDAGVVVCEEPIGNKDKTFIITTNPKYVYAEIINKCVPMVYATGKYKIGSNAKIHPTAIIYDNVIIGNNAKIHPYCVIGAGGFSPFWEGEKQYIFPHIGGVIIGDDVEIQAMTNIDRGGIGNTIIGTNTKIDTQCHIGHNTRIGDGCTICAKTQTGGSNVIGDKVFIAPNVAIRTMGYIWAGGSNKKSDYITIGDGAFIGFGSLVVKDVKPGERVMGHPAKPI